MSKSSAKPKMIKIVSTDDVRFFVRKDKMHLSKLIRDYTDDNPTIIANSPAIIVEKLIAFCAFHADEPKVKETMDHRRIELCCWDAELLDMPNETMPELIGCAEFFGCKALIDVACLKMAMKKNLK